MDRKFKKIILITICILIFVNAFFVQLCNVSGNSMDPTLKEGQVLLINKIDRTYNRMDIVILNNHGKWLIKRIVALPNETIKINNDMIQINGLVIDDVVTCRTDPGIAVEEIALQDDEYFVLGDNRTNSLDSRDERLGIVKESQIIGKIQFSLLPLKIIK